MTIAIPVTSEADAGENERFPTNWAPKARPLQAIDPTLQRDEVDPIPEERHPTGWQPKP